HGQRARRHRGRPYRGPGREPHRRARERPVRRADRVRPHDRRTAGAAAWAVRGAGGEAVTSRLPWRIAFFVLGLLAALAAPHVLTGVAAQHLLVMITINVILVASLDLLVGGAGLISLGHAAFMGVGAYASALLVRS